MATARSRQRRTRATRSTRRRTASSRRAPARSRRPDVLSLLKEDHRRVREMFDRFERAQRSSKDQLANRICEELELHARLEEELFYPAVREALRDEEIVEEAEVEHQSAKQLISQIQSSSSDDERFDALVKVLGEYVKHHIKEEEGEMFRQVRSSRLDTVALGEQLQERKNALQTGPASRAIEAVGRALGA